MWWCLIVWANLAFNDHICIELKKVLSWIFGALGTIASDLGKHALRQGWEHTFAKLFVDRVVDGLDGSDLLRAVAFLSGPEPNNPCMIVGLDQDFWILLLFQVAQANWRIDNLDACFDVLKYHPSIIATVIEENTWDNHSSQAMPLLLCVHLAKVISVGHGLSGNNLIILLSVFRWHRRQEFFLLDLQVQAEFNGQLWRDHIMGATLNEEARQNAHRDALG